MYLPVYTEPNRAAAPAHTNILFAYCSFGSYRSHSAFKLAFLLFLVLLSYILSVLAYAWCAEGGLKSALVVPTWPDLICVCSSTFYIDFWWFCLFGVDFVWNVTMIVILQSIWKKEVHFFNFCNSFWFIFYGLADA